MNTDNITVVLTLPKAIGKSLTLEVARNTTVADVIKQSKQVDLTKKVLRNSNEFNQFPLVYLNRERINDPHFSIKNSCEIEIIIPMAGG